MRYKEYLRNELDKNNPDNLPLPKGYHLIGHVALLVLNFEDRDFATKVGKCTLGYDSRIRSVAIRTGPTSSDIRKPVYELIAGQSDTLTTHIENNVKFRIDPLRVTFSGGNRRERISLPQFVQSHEYVVDMFACVGQFGLHIAKTAGAKVLAIEMNPEAYSLLEENIRINHVENKMQAVFGDCRKVHPNGVADRIIMGYLPGTIDFLPSALDTLSQEGGTIHIHDSLPENEIGDYCNTINTLASEWGFASVVLPRKIKHYSPGISHYVFDVSVLPNEASEA
ncbi:MAG: 50S ribosomal protein L11 methyltransferase [Candidatus Thorarchaeota archaeon]|nr:50S ribosomal protein L11 methyltransferase [Candidatus Thorarchaeota archaeon]